MHHFKGYSGIISLLNIRNCLIRPDIVFSHKKPSPTSKVDEVKIKKGDDDTYKYYVSINEKSHNKWEGF